MGILSAGDVFFSASWVSGFPAAASVTGLDFFHFCPLGPAVVLLDLLFGSSACFEGAGHAISSGVYEDSLLQQALDGVLSCSVELNMTCRIDPDRGRGLVSLQAQLGDFLLQLVRSNLRHGSDFWLDVTAASRTV